MWEIRKLKNEEGQVKKEAKKRIKRKREATKGRRNLRRVVCQRGLIIAIPSWGSVVTHCCSPLVEIIVHYPCTRTLGFLYVK
jgi:hypothetical protein